MSESIVPAATGAPSIVQRLSVLFEALPDDDLLTALRGPRRPGRPGYDPEILWRCFVTYYALGLESVSALVRLLNDNPFIAAACGITDEMPSQPTLSRFGSKLSKKWFSLAVKNVMRSLVQQLRDASETFGKTVAIDSTTIKAWSNGGKKGKRHSSATVKRHPALRGKVSDPDAGWAAKAGTDGKTKYTWGYKVHILCDAESELPIAIKVSAGNQHDVNFATQLLSQSRETMNRLPKYVLADAGYSSDRVRQAIRQHFHATPVIDPNPAHKRATARTNMDEEWKALYRQRTAVERLNGRLKGFYKLNDVRVRGKTKVAVHALLASIVLLASAATHPTSLRSRL